MAKATLPSKSSLSLSATGVKGNCSGASASAVVTVPAYYRSTEREAVLQACRAAGITLPVVAIGGITAADVAPLLDAGATGIALSGALLGAEDPAEETRKIMNILNHHKL